MVPGRTIGAGALGQNLSTAYRVYLDTLPLVKFQSIYENQVSVYLFYDTESSQSNFFVVNRERVAGAVRLCALRASGRGSTRPSPNPVRRLQHAVGTHTHLGSEVGLPMSQESKRFLLKGYTVQYCSQILADMVFCHDSLYLYSLDL